MYPASRLFDLRPSGFINLGSYCAEFTDVGVGEPIVVLPGLMGGTGLLAPIVRKLSQRHRVITYQLRGESQALFDRGFGFGRLVEDLDCMLAQLQLERPGILGVSFGAALALEFVARHPNRVSFLAVQGAAAQFRAGIFSEVARQVLDRFPLPANNPHVNQFFKLLLPLSASRRSDLDLVVDQCWRTDQSVMAHRLAMLEGFDVLNRLSDISMPTLAFSCDSDVLVNDREIESMSRALPQCELKRLEGAGHFAFVSHVESMCNAVANFAGTATLARS